jgi:hypothetical protein
MPPRQGPLRRIEQLRRELEAEGKLAPETEQPPDEPAWKTLSKPLNRYRDCPPAIGTV